MGIDKTTAPSAISVTMNTNSKYIKELKQQAIDNDQNWGDNGEKVENMTLSDDTHAFTTCEYYYDETNNVIHLSGSLKSLNGESSIYLEIPLSDIVLIDILQHAIKKLNKLKSVMEALK